MAAVYTPAALERNMVAAERPVGRVLAPRESAVWSMRSHGRKCLLIFAVMAEHTADVGR